MKNSTSSPSSQSDPDLTQPTSALPDSKVDWASYIDDYSRIRDRIADVYPAIYADFGERIKAPKGFHLDIAPRRRAWLTPNGKANFLPLPGLHVDAPVDDPGMLRLATVRSHDQFNTTIYSYNDRYRGVYNDRMVVFMNAADIARRGLAADDLVDLTTAIDDGIERRVNGFRVVPYNIPEGCIGAYFPEANPLVPLSHHDKKALTPAYKATPVRVSRSGASRAEAT